ncbi:MAG: ribose 5-phosphate isomerase B [Armatimonadetes bacterium]|nr:ribose 5-phosphate isomerase B [Armatimonadota bacterium]
MAEYRPPKAGRIVLGSDHAGFAYKQRIVKKLAGMDVRHEDFGAHSDEPSDYVDYALKVAKAVADGEAEFGILVCGSGVGMDIAANKVPGVRAGLCSDTYTARMCREHNDTNVLVLAERVIGIELAMDVVDAWLNTPFSGEERHVRRLEKIHRAEEEFGTQTQGEAKGCG